MPFVNGRFYMNPAHGRAVERARIAQTTSDHPDSRLLDPDAHWVTLNHRHVLIHEAQREHAQRDKARNRHEARLAIIVYNETSSLRSDPRAKSGEGASAEDLHDAREGIAKIAKRAIDSGHANRVAPPDLSDKDAQAIRAGNPDAVRAYNDSLAAAREALKGANETKGATQYRLRPPGISSDRPINGKDTSFAYGPFPNTLGPQQTIVFAP